MSAGARRGDRVVVIGAGAAGLATAMELAAAGMQVVVLEKETACGGKMRPVKAGGASYDGGPTVLTMRWVFEELFAAAGKSLDRQVRLNRAQTLARHGWQDGSQLDLHADREASAAAIADFAGASEADGYRRFCRDSAATFDALRHSYIEASRPNPLQLAARVLGSNPAGALALRPFSTMWSALGRYFRDPRLRQLYGRYATYCGSSPFLAPATLTLVAHVEQEGVWTVDGGMRALASAMETAGRDAGAVYRKGVTVDSIVPVNGRFEVHARETGAIDAAAVVWCADQSGISTCLAGADRAAGKPTARPERSLSALVWLAKGRAAGRKLAHHTVCFSRNYKAEFADLMDRRIPAEDPTVYICAQDRNGFGGDPDGSERLYLLSNAPADGDSRYTTRSEAAKCLRNALRTIGNSGFRLELEEEPALTAPQDWHKLFPGTGGALYGRASHGWTASFRRQGSRTKLPGLYLAGGSVHPGPGVPMAAISGRLAAQAVIADLLSTRRLHPAAIAGGTPTA